MCTYIYLCMYTCIYTYICIHRHTCRIRIIRDVLRLCHMRHSCVFYACVIWDTHDSHSHVTYYTWNDAFHQEGRIPRHLSCLMKRKYYLSYAILWVWFIWDTTHSYETPLIHMRHDSFICDILYVKWSIPSREENSVFRVLWREDIPCVCHMRHDSLICDLSYETWLNHIWRIICGILCVCHTRHDSSIWDTTHSYETWLIHMRYHIHDTWHHLP